MGEECLICKDSLEYLKADVLMECAICHKKENSKTRCVRGHYVCNECHTQGMDAIVGLCMAETSKNPVAIIEKMMQMPFCHMHGPEHHVMVGAALLTAFKNAGGEIDLRAALAEMVSRGKAFPAAPAASGVPAEPESARGCSSRSFPAPRRSRSSRLPCRIR